jgi:hypothetical protein
MAHVMCGGWHWTDYIVGWGQRMHVRVPCSDQLLCLYRELQSNGITTLPADVFAGLTQLTQL